MSRVLITGCSSGIGRATASHLADHGHEVIATARKLETLDDLDVAERYILDVQDSWSVAALFEATGPVDVLVNNAGVAVRGPVEAVSIDAVGAMLDINVVGLLRMVGTYAPSMRAQGHGTIVNVSSVTGRIALPLAGVYGASKAAADAITEALRFELGHFGVHVTSVVPGLVGTGGFESSPVFTPEDAGYEPLIEQLGRPSAITPVKAVAEAVQRVIEEPASSPLRIPVGDPVSSLLSARAAMDDLTFDRTLRSVLAVDW